MIHVNTLRKKDIMNWNRLSFTETFEDIFIKHIHINKSVVITLLQFWNYCTDCLNWKYLINNYFQKVTEHFHISNLFWIAERECNKDEMKNGAIFIEFRMCNFHLEKYCLNMIVGSDSGATGPDSSIRIWSDNHA